MTHTYDHDVPPEDPDDGHLSPLRLEALRLGQASGFEYSHLRGCERCRAGLALHRRLAHELAPAADPPFAIPDERRQAILADARRALPPDARGSLPDHARRAWMPLALAATLLVGIAIGRWAGEPPSHRSERTVASTTPPPGARQDPLTGGSSVGAPTSGPSRPGDSGRTDLSRGTTAPRTPPPETRPPTAPHEGVVGDLRDRPTDDSAAWGRAEPGLHAHRAPLGSAPALPSTGLPAPAWPERGVPDSSTVAARRAPDTDASRISFKLATVLPDGAPSTTELKTAADALATASGDTVKLKLYFGVVGDEQDIVRKLELGQLQAAHLTAFGLAQIVPAIHVLDLPFFFSSYAQVDHVYENTFAYFQHAFREKGFELLAFTETGWVHLYSNSRIEDLDGLRGAKIWAAEGDPLIAAFASEARMPMVTLGIPDVLQSLQTGLIDTVYASPSAMIGLQWFTKVKYVQPLAFAHATGGLVMTTKAFDSLDRDRQAILARTIAAQAKSMTDSSRRVNEDSKAVIAQAGVEVLPRPSRETFQRLRDVSNRVIDLQADKLYPKVLLERVRALRDEAGGSRAQHDMQRHDS